MLIIVGSGSGKTNAFLNLIKEQDNDELIGKFCLYANEPKYQFFIKNNQEAGMYLNDSKAFADYSQYMDDVYNIDNYNSKKI